VGGCALGEKHRGDIGVAPGLVSSKGRIDVVLSTASLYKLTIVSTRAELTFKFTQETLQLDG